MRNSYVVQMFGYEAYLANRYPLDLGIGGWSFSAESCCSIDLWS